MEWANFARTEFAMAVAGWIVTALLALRSQRLLREQLSRSAPVPGVPKEKRLRTLQVILDEDDDQGPCVHTAVYDASELLRKLDEEAASVRADGTR